MDTETSLNSTVKLEAQANRHTISCLIFTLLPFAAIWLLNILGVFIEEKHIMTPACLAVVAVLLAPKAICHFTGVEKPWVKYMLLFCMEAAIVLTSIALNFQAALLFTLPLIYASQYSSKRMVVYAYLLTVCALSISVMGGYYFDICDSNISLPSNQSASYFIQLFSSPSRTIFINSNPWASLLLYFVLPRSIILLAFIPIISQLSRNVAESTVYTAELVKISETDKLTQFYNKRKFDEMAADYYPALDLIAVLFFDINNLKQINDTYGHAEGDQVIACVAGCVLDLVTGSRKVYRVGGDEFVMVLEAPSEDEPAAVASAFYDSLAIRQQSLSSASVSASIGWAVGPGQELRSLMEQADSAMYRNKRIAHDLTAANADPAAGLDRTGLDDRTFQAISAVSDRMYFYLCNMQTNVSRWSANAVDYFDLPGEYMLDAGTVWEERIHPEDRGMYHADIENVFSGKKRRHNLEYRVRNKYGDYVICTCSGIVQKGTNGEPDIFVGTIINHGIIDTVDPVTNLYNIYELSAAIQSLQATHTPAILLFIGISHFHFINETYDYVFGNKVLHALAQALLVEARKRNSAVYRLDGAKFALCLRGSTPEDVRELYESLRRLASEKLVVEGTPVPLSIGGGAVCVGTTTCGEYPISSSAIYALGLSKRERHGELVFFDNELGNNTRRSIDLLNILRQDIVNGCQHFYLVYQPLVRAEDGRVSGMEALLRWKHPIHGEIPPGRFIPVLENETCFYDLGSWILRQALEEAKPIVDKDPHFFLNINVSYTQIERSGFRDNVMDALGQTGYPPTNLCLELTERCRSLNAEYLRSELQFFRSRGIRISLDDFGTGLSSLNLICDLPVDGLKIDQGFIFQILENKSSQMVVESTIDLTHKLGIDVCLEGVENQQLRDFLLRYSVNHHQGFYYARPQPIDAFRRYLEENRATHPE